jgi:hypothetical protein
LAPIVDNGSRIDAFELARRPVTDHLGYLIALGLTFVLVILLRQRVVEKWPILVLGLVVGVSAVLFFGVRQVPNGDSPSFEEVRSYVLDAETHQTCSSDLGWLRVCMYRGYEGWVPRFESMLESVVDGVDLDGRVLTVRQRPFRLPAERRRCTRGESGDGALVGTVIWVLSDHRDRIRWRQFGRRR